MTINFFTVREALVTIGFPRAASRLAFHKDMNELGLDIMGLSELVGTLEAQVGRVSPHREGIDLSDTVGELIRKFNAVERAA